MVCSTTIQLTRICQGLCAENFQRFLDIKSINITAHFSSIVGFGVIHQIFTIPHAQLLARVHPVRMGEKRQDDFWGMRVISRNLWPPSSTRIKREELTRRQKSVISRCCYDDRDMIFKISFASTAPERPVRCGASSITGNVAVQMNQFHSSQLATGRSVKPAIVAVFRAKTHRWGICLLPATYTN